MSTVKRILVPIDFSEGAKAAAQYAITLAKQFNATLDLLYIWEYPYYVGQDVMLQVPGQTAQSIIEYAKQQAQSEMITFLSKLSKEGVTIKEHIKGGIVDREIIEMVTKDHIDMIVMGTHGRSGISRLLLGSVAEKVLRNSPCPVVTISAHSEKK
ncbi:MAG: universal stress protein [Planctomycetota bacterium]